MSTPSKTRHILDDLSESQILELRISTARSYLEDALTTNDAQHKQRYLWHIAEALGINLAHINADQGTAP